MHEDENVLKKNSKYTHTDWTFYRSINLVLRSYFFCKKHTHALNSNKTLFPLCLKSVNNRVLCETKIFTAQG